MYQYYVLYLAWWWINEPKNVAEFLILITNICCVYWLNELLYYEKNNCKKSAEEAFVLYPGGTGAMWTRDATCYLYEILREILRQKTGKL